VLTTLFLFLQECSRHRSKNPPPASSPKVCWELDLREDNTQNKTQIGRPLRTRKRIRKPNYEDEFDIDDRSEDSQIIWKKKLFPNFLKSLILCFQMCAVIYHLIYLSNFSLFSKEVSSFCRKFKFSLFSQNLKCWHL
jgi:hypothetical protein